MEFRNTYIVKFFVDFLNRWITWPPSTKCLNNIRKNNTHVFYTIQNGSTNSWHLWKTSSGSCYLRNALPDSWYLKDVPLYGHVELWQVHAHYHHVGAFDLINMAQVHLREKMGRWGRDYLDTMGVTVWYREGVPSASRWSISETNMNCTVCFFL